MTETIARLMSRSDLATMLNVSIRTLENWEKQEYGPRPMRMNRSVRYNPRDVEAFVKSLTNVAS